MTQEKEKLISKANLFNQITNNGEEKKLNLFSGEEKLNLFSGEAKFNLFNEEEKFNLYNGEEKFNLLNGEEGKQKCNQMSNGKEKLNLFDKKGKGVLVMEAEPSNSNTEHMDVDEEPMATHFHEEILMDILNRLPVRSLLRFKCVSKFWGTFISDPYFKMKHLNHAKHDKNSQKLLISKLYPQGISPMYGCPLSSVQLVEVSPMYCCPLSSVQLVEDVQKLDYPTSFIPQSCTLHCCCDGLVIIKVIIDNILDKDSILLLWNPSTRESIVLPEFLHVEYCCLGLGYDSTSGDYKILKIHCNLRTSGEILALKDGRWRNIDKYPLADWSLLDGTFSLAVVHEAFHWFVAVGEYIVGKPLEHSLVSFSISNEVYGEIPLPEQLLCSALKFGVSVLNEMLCVYSTSVRQLEALKLWVLKDYDVKESWNVLFTIYDPLIRFFQPKYRFADGEVLFWCTDNQFREAVFRTSRGPFVSWPQSGQFIGIAFSESLISPKSLTY